MWEVTNGYVPWRNANRNDWVRKIRKPEPVSLVDDHEDFLHFQIQKAIDWRYHDCPTAAKLATNIDAPRMNFRYAGVDIIRAHPGHSSGMESINTLTSESYRVQQQSTSKRSSSPLKQTIEQGSVANANHPHSPQSDSYKQTAKRKRAHDTTHLETPYKKNRVHGAITPSSSPEVDNRDCQYGHSINWEEYFGHWPPPPNQKRIMSGPLANKRSRSQSSYSQSVRDGNSPAAWTRQHEEKMLEAGLIMSGSQHRAVITDECRQLCESLLKKEYPLPDDPSFQLDRLAKVLDRVRFRNEARVVRDVLPIVVPSPELLHVDGHDGLDHICEAINAEWTQCDTLCGPRPKPDFVVGISSSAFANEEKLKLRLNHTSACPNFFPENMYFPFLICEVKGSDRPLIEAERQAMHSASIAVRAIVQLHRKASLTSEINQEILVFSVAHDHASVKIFGHLAKVEDDKITFFRHQLFSGDFDADISSGKWTKAYQITRAIYEYFYPKHLARVKRALSNMQGPPLVSATSSIGMDLDSHESTAESPSQEDERFKKPLLPPMVKLQQENLRLHDQLLQAVHSQQVESGRLREEQLDQRTVMERQMVEQKEQLDRQLAQQKEESHERNAMMERQMVEQKEQMERQLAQQKEESHERNAMMERQMVEQKEQMERQLAQQKEESHERNAMMERQMVQQDEIIKLLKETGSKRSPKE
ncbi:hypothetical protein FH972_024112 [Carpinus fangiana]|uniref:DUF7924 domain-containing protein n=1 Tax=Carpinus fangiana TaxID=176857 RepID=A0A5N6KZK8_9ROSI|nr:hypothetical protein FH972_024112 [Carpinus fangiana]